MKAWSVFLSDSGPSEGCILVWATTRNKARQLAGPDLSDYYIEVGAKRVPELDYDFPEGKEIHDNAELRKIGLPNFYNFPEGDYY